MSVPQPVQRLVDAVGRYPLLDARLRVRHPRETLALRRLGRELAAGLLAGLGGVPEADVVTVIPTHGRGELLQRAVRSALDQTHLDHHVVVVDDGAGLPGLPHDPRLTALSLPRNVGIAGVVRNVGLHVSRSRLLAFLDDDNTWRPDHLERSLAAHAGGPALSYTGLKRVHPDGRVHDVLSRPFDRHDLRSHAFVDTSTIVVARSDRTTWSCVPRRFGDSPGEDWEYVWRLSRHLPVHHIDALTVDVLVNPDSHYQDWAGRAVTDA